MRTQIWIYLGAWTGILWALAAFIFAGLLSGDVRDPSIIMPTAATLAMGLCLLGVASDRVEKRVKELLLGMVILIGLAATWIERLLK